MSDRGRHVPWVTLAFVAAAAVASVAPWGEAAFGWTADGARSAPWRRFTSQLLHDTPGLMALDLAAVLIAGALVESGRRGRHRVTLVLLGGAVATVLAVLAAGDEVRGFAGASGIASALVVAAGARFVLDGAGLRRGLGALAVAMLLTKAALEHYADFSWSTAHLAAGTQVLASAHLAGGLAGLGIMLALAAQRSPSSSTPSPSAMRLT